MPPANQPACRVLAWQDPRGPADSRGAQPPLLRQNRVRKPSPPREGGAALGGLGSGGLLDLPDCFVSPSLSPPSRKSLMNPLGLHTARLQTTGLMQPLSGDQRGTAKVSACWWHTFPCCPAQRSPDSRQIWGRVRGVSVINSRSVPTQGTFHRELWVQMLLPPLTSCVASVFIF